MMKSKESNNPILTKTNEFAKQLRSLREEYSYTQHELALQLNISDATYAHWEQGRAEANIDSCIKLAELYGISLDELMGRDDYIQEKSLSVHEKEVISLIRQLKDRSDIAEVIGFLHELNNKTDNPYNPNEDAISDDISTRYRA